MGAVNRHTTEKVDCPGKFGKSGRLLRKGGWNATHAHVEGLGNQGQGLWEQMSFFTKGSTPRACHFHSFFLVFFFLNALIHKYFLSPSYVPGTVLSDNKRSVYSSREERCYTNNSTATD